LLSSILQAFILGLTISIMVGPIFFAVIEITLSKGFKAGLGINVGAWVSDILFVLMSYFGLHFVSQFTSLPNFKLTIGVIGGIILIITGIFSLLNTRKVELAKSKSSFENQKNYFGLASKGFIINLFNPFNLIFWLGITTNSIKCKENGPIGQEIFLFALVSTIILFDMLKLILAKKIRNRLSQKNILKTRKIAGFILMILGVLLIIRSL
jgi:threonine/homoserine/homoserine lactone efflux protein